MKKLWLLLCVLPILCLCQEPQARYEERIGLWIVMQEKAYNFSKIKNVFTKKDLEQAELWAQQYNGEVKMCYAFRQASWWRFDEKYILAVNIPHPTWIDVLWRSRGWHQIPEQLTIHTISADSVKDWFEQNYHGTTDIDGYTESLDSPDATKM